MQKILIIHNNYKITGGEDTNIVEEIKMLKEKFEVETLFFSNSDKFNFFDLVSILFGKNLKSDIKIKKKVQEFQPNIVYIHNIWYKVSFGVFKILKEKKIKTLFKIHNFRYECSRHFLVKNHINSYEVCNACSNSRSSLQIFNKYFPESYLKSIFSIIFSKRLVKALKQFDIKVLVISKFHKSKIISNGIDRKKVYLLHNPLDIKSNYLKKTYNPNSDYVVFAGRLTKSKGIEHMIQAWLRADLDNIRLKIIGDGELLLSLKDRYESNQITFLGQKDLDKTQEEISNARSVITCTKMYEGQPRLLTEASSLKIPSIYPSFGSMNEFFPEGYELSFEQFNYKSLDEKLNLLKNKDLLSKVSDDVYQFVEKTLASKHILKQFQNINEYEY